MFWSKTREWPRLTIEEIRKRARLLVIDDQEFAYQTLFDRDGYRLEKWNDVERLSDIERGDFDLVLLDLQGVGQKESSEQGFGVLKHLRVACPTLVIVAFSNADWGLEYQEFFKLADAVLPKSADYVEFKQQVDELLKRRFSLGFFVSKILAETATADADQSRMDKVAREAILRGDVSKLKRHLGSLSVDSATIDRVLSIANSAIGLIQLWNG